MSGKRLSGALLGLVGLIAISSSQGAPVRTCEGLTRLSLPHTTILSAKAFPAGVQALKTLFYRSVTLGLPGRCQVDGVSRPSSDSEIRFEVWLPLTGWNGQYVQKGNGGFAGAVLPETLVDPLRRGYVAAATDDGHDYTKTPDGTFAIGHPEKVIDFGYRAVHETSKEAKALAAAFYGKPVKRSYFVGCSDGGREALMEAQRFPEDFNGIIAGAPAYDWSHLMTSFAWNALALNKDAAHRIPIDKLPLVQRAEIAACDGADGLKDGLVSNPLACHFSAAVLKCKRRDGEDCLTQAQVDTLKALYSGPRNPRTGKIIFPGIPPSGTEALPESWPEWLLKSGEDTQSNFALSYYRDVVLEHLGWQLKWMDFDRDVRISDQKAAPIIAATDPDLRSFRDHGGKLLQFHGWGDAAIVATSSIQYYEAVRSFLRTYPDPRSPSNSVNDFYRLFMVPGMAHCSGGVGPVEFGNGPIFGVKPPASTDPERNIFDALVRWVEQGIAPDQLIGSGPSPRDPKKTMTRPLCPYPQQARYKGVGDINSADSFVCAK
jgi:feruloyl esterase